MQRVISRKVCMLGTFGVGKTSLVRRFVYNRFDEKYLSTIGVQISQKQLPPLQKGDSDEFVQYKFILWDLAHIEKFDSMIKNYFRGAHGAFVVFDLTRPDTLQTYSSFLDPFLQTNPNSKIIFIGNKIDLIESPDEELQQLEKIAACFKAPFFTTSAKTGENVEKMFIKMGGIFIED
ncbi:GTP-binding protein [candidate division KSB1 bacterium]|nr:GTP-binding protein [candidate division KSB1 bacterium]